jgi:alanine racemase
MSVRHPNWIEIDLDALQNNLQYLRSSIPKSTALLLPVKADAYGHGSLAVSYTAQKSGLVDMLGVAHLFEGALLRQYGITLPILVLGPAFPEDYEYLQSYQLTATINNIETARLFNQKAREDKKQCQVHVKIDTGMNRYGLSWQDKSVLEELFSLEHLHIQGFYSHLATADMPEHPAAQQQIANFKETLTWLEENNIRPPLCHLANSAGTLNYSDEIAFDMIRPGIASYGYHPMGLSAMSKHPQLKPMLSMKASIQQIREVPTGAGVSYGHIWNAEQSTRIAAVAIGYGDGFPRGKEDQGMFYIHGQACPIRGRICMDTTMVDISAVENVQLGDVVSVMDGLLHKNISLEAWADRHETISYELACRVARRLYRYYRWQGKIIRWDDLKNILGVPEPNLDIGLAL